MKRAEGAVREVSSVMEDFRMQAVGGMEGAWELWESGISKNILANFGTWVELKEEGAGMPGEFPEQVHPDDAGLPTLYADTRSLVPSRDAGHEA